MENLGIDEALPVLQDAVDQISANFKLPVISRTKAVFPDDDKINQLNELIWTVSVNNPIEGDELHYHFRRFIDSHIYRHTKPVLINMNGEQFLQELVSKWQDHQSMTDWLIRIFKPLEEICIPSLKPRPPPLKEVSYSCFHTMVYRRFKLKMNKIIAEMIDAERKGANINSAVIKGAHDMHNELTSVLNIEDFNHHSKAAESIDREAKKKFRTEKSAESEKCTVERDVAKD